MEKIKEKQDRKSWRKQQNVSGILDSQYSLYSHNIPYIFFSGFRLNPKSLLGLQHDKSGILHNVALPRAQECTQQIVEHN